LNEQAKARLRTIEALKKIPGIGWVPHFDVVCFPVNRIFRNRTATNLVNAGAASASDLRHPKYQKLLSPNQKVGVLYDKHMTRLIPRSEAEEIAVRTYLFHSFVMLMAIQAFIRDHISCNFEVHLTGA
jgi:hypothetical protein